MADSPEPTDHKPERRGRFSGNQGLAYQGAFEAVASIMIGGGLGYFADEYFDTSPMLLLVGFVFGFGAFFVRLMRLNRALKSNEHSPDQSDDI